MDNENKETKLENLFYSLSPYERDVFPYLKEYKFNEIIEKTGLQEVSVLRALEFLSNKDLIKLDITSKKIIDLDLNGVLYKSKGFPERRLINILGEKNSLSFEEAMNLVGISDNELRAAVGALKKKALVEVINGKIIFTGSKTDIVKKSLEELFIESLPLDFDSLEPEQKFAFESLKNRKQIIEIKQRREIECSLTQKGEELIKKDFKLNNNLIEILTPEILKKNLWKGKQFRRYDIKSSVPKIYGGKRHFVNQAVDYARRVWTDMGFEEMNGSFVLTGFWNFDALFTAQDHPVREMHDTFYLEDVNGNLIDKSLVNSVKQVHEKGISGSKGWQYNWVEEDAKKVVLRTHTTPLSAQTLYALSNLKKEKKLKDIKKKFFAIGKTFRNETLDWSHGFEFNQTEGIVIDKDVNFRHLLGYLKEFFNKMGFEKIRFTPGYFPYTEPSVEINWWHPEKKAWLELGGAGIFRPEVTITLLGEWMPVLAWGPGFDRILMDYYEIKDLRELYENNLNKLREKKFWLKN